MLNGWKTYIVAAAVFITGGLVAGGYITQEVANLIMMILGGAGLTTLRMAVAENNAKAVKRDEALRMAMGATTVGVLGKCPSPEK